jgi:ABC-type Zn2+ transport system substrate-binding protein/surface adhesin
MTHRRPLAISLIVTLALAAIVLVARDELVSSGEADIAAPATTVAATEIPLVNLVQTADGQQVAVPAGSLDQRAYEDDEEHDDDHDDDDDHEDEDDDDD